MAVDKTIDYVIQDGYNNYTKNSKSVTVPKKFKARKNAPATKLAYITEAEAKQLKKQNPGTPHKGPSNIPSYDSFDAEGNYSSGAAQSAAETGGNSDRDRRDMAQGRISPQEAQAIRSAAINAGAGQRVNPGFFDSRTNLTPAETKAAKKARRDPNNLYGAKSFRNTGQSGIMNFIKSGGLFGNLARGLGQFFGLGKKPGEATYDMSEFNDIGLLSDRINPNFQNDLGNELMLSTQKTPERFLPNEGSKPVNAPASDAVSTLASSKFNRMKGYTDDYPNLGLISSTKEIPTVNGVPMINTGSVYQDNLDFFDNLNKGLVVNNEPPMVNTDNVMQGSVLDAQPKKGIMQMISESLFPEGNLQDIIKNSKTQKDYNINATKDLVENNPLGILGEVYAPVTSLVTSPFYDATQAFQRMEPDSGIKGFAKAFNAENLVSSALERAYGATLPLAERFANLNLSNPFISEAAAAEVRPAIGMENTGLGPVPTGDVGLNASGRLGNLSATVDAIDALKGESVNPQINYSGNFGNTTAYGNFSDDVQNLGLNYNNDKGLSGGISYDAITGEPRFDIGFRKTFADGGVASMFTRRG